MAVDNEFLKSLAYFSGLNDNELDSIRKSLFEKSTDRGEIILLEGEPSGELYFVVSGAVKLRAAILLPGCPLQGPRTAN